MIYRILYTFISILLWEKWVLTMKYLDPVPVGKRFIAEGIVPTVIAKPPNYTLQLTFGYNSEAFPGVILPYIDCKLKPRSRWKTPSTEYLYTYIIINADIPNNKTPNLEYAEYYPHIIRNIPGRKKALGEELLPYQLPKTPRKKSILMVALLYRQYEKNTEDVPYIRDEELMKSGKFRLQTYLQIQNIPDAPEAGNYFYISYDML